MTSIIFRIARSRWFRTGFAVVVMMVVVWFFGPMLGFGAMHPLETEIARYVVIGALFARWLISNLVHALNQHRREPRPRRRRRRRSPRRSRGPRPRRSRCSASGWARP